MRKLGTPLFIALLAVCLLAGCEMPDKPTPDKPTPAVNPKPQPERTFRDCPDCPELTRVQAGSFTMGSPSSEAGRDADEVQKQVTIAAFAVGVHEVTFAQWDACVAAGGCAGHNPADQGWGRGTRPVIDVSWNDAQAYVSWLSTKTGHQYRLLTEAEWEYVARADTTTPFHTGATISTAQANYDGMRTPYGSGQMGVYRAQTIDVGSFPANEFGLYDVHGNAAEWVEDCYDEEAENGTCSRRVVRGGSWADSPRLLRSAYRGWCAPTLRNDPQRLPRRPHDYSALTSMRKDIELLPNRTIRSSTSAEELRKCKRKG